MLGRQLHLQDAEGVVELLLFQLAIPRIGMTPRERTQAAASWAEIAPRLSATRSTSPAMARLRSVRRA